jgi:hypothetical protein
VVPADDKPYLRVQVAALVVQALESLDLRFPRVAEIERERFAEMRRLLKGEAGAATPKKPKRRSPA